MLNNQKISACLVIRNEEKNLSRCLESIKNVVDEIIIVHDGPCQDKSLAIAKKYTNKIFIRDLVGEAEPHRPFTYKKASGNWILQIDADEFLPLESRNKIRDLTNQIDIDAYAFLWTPYNIMERKFLPNHFTYKACLFRKEKMYMLGFVHFSPIVKGKLSKINLILGHLYQPRSLLFLFRKNRRWARIHAAQFFKDFSQIEKFQIQLSDWQKIINKLYVKYPLVFALPKAFKAALNDIFVNRSFEKGFNFGLHSIIIQFYYSLMLCLYIFYFKHFPKRFSMGSGPKNIHP